MRTPAKIIVSVLVVCAVVLVVRYARTEQVAVPKDMPRDAKFLQSGFDISTDEPQGAWVACRLEQADASDWCRVTDQKGIVLYQGDFLPVNSPGPLSERDLIVANVNPKKLWVRGPVEQAQVPVIPLTNGSVLVPAADRYALIQRWSKDSSEYDAVRSSTE